MTEHTDTIDGGDDPQKAWLANKVHLKVHVQKKNLNTTVFIM